MTFLIDSITIGYTEAYNIVTGELLEAEIIVSGRIETGHKPRKLVTIIIKGKEI